MNNSVPKQKVFSRQFLIGMLIYAVVLLSLIGLGLVWFWGFMADYEASRPQRAIDNYMTNLTKEHIADSCDELISSLDNNLQSKEICRGILMDALDGDITYVRKASACSQDRQVFELRCNKQTIGMFSIINPDVEHMVPWEFESESFDFTFLLTQEPVSVRVPEGFGVSVGGVMLDAGYIVEEQTEHFEILEDYYESYEPPVLTMQTYQAGPFLGQTPEIVIYDRSDSPVIYDESFDHNTLIPSLEGEIQEEFDEFVAEFVRRYAIYTGRANGRLNYNYSQVMQMVVRDSDLAKRLRNALDGLQYPKNLGLKITDVTGHHYVQLAEDVYLLDVTYVIVTNELDGVLENVSNARFLVVRQNGKLLVQSMQRY